MWTCFGSVFLILTFLVIFASFFFWQIFMRYGRQRWKLKGKIETNSKQSWDGEEMIFMPLITDLINIKVGSSAHSHPWNNVANSDSDILDCNHQRHSKRHVPSILLNIDSSNVTCCPLNLEYLVRSLMNARKTYYYKESYAFILTKTFLNWQFSIQYLYSSRWQS